MAAAKSKKTKKSKSVEGEAPAEGEAPVDIKEKPKKEVVSKEEVS